ncbi:DoxX family protein [Aquimarina muelleri]|uniref:DoxX family protein n=1 Tax=Aquimarina muelleri TaxID=279356 RepID=A0A918JVU4_9FLAO|nr:DoxX family protein [Aquimarina muelleri]MCX2761903.1 DoxX family protein [Aquimarina muelleri]GGX10229.1 hypothetical protein GCM10007384_09940 [Aquimarina muelleri]
MNWHIFILAFIFCTAGFFHLIRPKAFMRVMPLYIPYSKVLVYISGIGEILSGLGLLFTSTRTIAAWTIISMLFLFFPVHIHMLVNKKASLNLPKTILILRILLQFGLIYWAYLYI